MSRINTKRVFYTFFRVTMQKLLSNQHPQWWSWITIDVWWRLNCLEWNLFWVSCHRRFWERCRRSRGLHRILTMNFILGELPPTFLRAMLQKQRAALLFDLLEIYFGWVAVDVFESDVAEAEGCIASWSSVSESGDAITSSTSPLKEQKCITMGIWNLTILNLETF